jgi:hypothetical protein
MVNNTIHRKLIDALGDNWFNVVSMQIFLFTFYLLSDNTYVFFIFIVISFPVYIFPFIIVKLYISKSWVIHGVLVCKKPLRNCWKSEILMSYFEILKQIGLTVNYVLIGTGITYVFFIFIVISFPVYIFPFIIVKLYIPVVFSTVFFLNSWSSRGI